MWSTDPGPTPFASIDVTGDVAAEEQPRPVVDEGAGDATVVGYTVVHNDDTRRGVALLDLADGQRCMAGTDEPA